MHLFKHRKTHYILSARLVKLVCSPQGCVHNCDRVVININKNITKKQLESLIEFLNNDIMKGKS